MPVPVLEVLSFDGCPNHAALVRHLQDLLEDAGVHVKVRLREVSSDEEAQRLRFLGSPSLRVDGRDIDPAAADRQDYGLQCSSTPPQRVWQGGLQTR